ncbi:MAG: ABC transporter substrate-binding protein, partial [Pseudomonadota bacterium]
MIRKFLLAVLVLCSGKPGLADGWPVEIANRYGTTRIEAAPTRVLSLSYVGHDFLLSLGVRPIAVRHWYGDHPHGVWPWARDALGDARPEVLRGDINVERIARLAPDLIVGQWSGMTAADYALLSRIAPTLAPA